MEKIKNNKTNIGIIGVGEIGSAVSQLYTGDTYNVLLKDVEVDDSLELYDLEYIHICIPYTESFSQIVTDYIKEYSPKNVIIHSTVKVGTTANLIQETGHSNIFHSPIRGVHPNLLEGLTTFSKYLGVEEVDDYALEVLNHLGSLNLDLLLVTPAATSEIAKLFSTSYYGLCIAWHGEMKVMCDKAGVDFGLAVTEWTKSYNEGYTKLGMGNVCRPVLTPPTNIGGHCIIPNAELLKEQFDSACLDLILKWK